MKVLEPSEAVVSSLQGSEMMLFICPAVVLAVVCAVGECEHANQKVLEELYEYSLRHAFSQILLYLMQIATDPRTQILSVNSATPAAPQRVQVLFGCRRIEMKMLQDT